MEPRELRTLNQKEYFSPWNDQPSNQLYSLNSPSNKISQAIRKDKAKIRQKLRLKENFGEEVNVEDKAKLTLLDLGHQQKQQKILNLKQFLKKQCYLEHRSSLPKNSHSFKLPSINNPKEVAGLRSLTRNRDNTSSEVSVNKIKIQNQEEMEIFKKYGSHRKRSIERSNSIVSGVKQKGSKSELNGKYQTLDVCLNKADHPLDMRHLKLRGKKYSYELRNRSLRRDDDDLSYLPSQPNITPHHVLFGANQQEVFKKVFKQLSHKAK